MKYLFPIVIEQEANGAFSAHVAGLPVYAQARTRAKVERDIGKVLTAYLDEHQDAVPSTEVRVAAVSRRASGLTISIKGPGALVAATTSAAKVVSSRANGRKGGRPRKSASA